MTVDEIRTAFEDAKDELIDDNKFYRWMNYIESSLREKLVRIDAERFIAEEEYSVLSGTEEYALPVDFSHINAKSCGFFLLTDSGKLSSKLSETAYGSESQGYYFKKDKVHFTGLLDASVSLRYIPSRDEITANEDIVLGGKDFLPFYEQALSKYLAIEDEEVEEEEISSLRADKILESLLNNYNRSTNTLDVSAGDFY